MGTQQSNICSIDSFVLSSGVEKDLANIKEEELFNNLMGLYNLFKENPNAYQEYKIEEEKQTNKRFDIKRLEVIDDLDIDVKQLTKYQKYQFIISKILNTPVKDYKIHLVIVKLMSFIIKERDFLHFFLKQSLDTICTKIINIEKVTTKSFIIVGNDLLNEVMKIFIEESTILPKNLIFLTKIYNVCKKLIDKENLEDSVLCMSFCDLLKSSVILLTKLENICKNPKIPHKKDFQDFIRNILNEFYLCTYFANIANSLTQQKITECNKTPNEILSLYMLNDVDDRSKMNSTKGVIEGLPSTPGDMIQLETPNAVNLNKTRTGDSMTDEEKLISDINFSDTFPSLVIQIFNLLCKIPVALRDKVIKPEQEVETLFLLVINRISDNKKLNQDIISFIITYYISNCLYMIDEKNKLGFLINNRRSFENKIEELFKQFTSSSDEEMKFLLSCFFLIISINRDIWVYLKSQNVIQATKAIIIDYIKGTFNPRVIKQSDSNPNDEGYFTRIRKILKLIEIFMFISNDEIYSPIRHVKLFSTYFDVVILLFFINSPIMRLEILTILNTFTLFQECKIIFLDKTYANVHSKLYQRLEQLFVEIEKANSLIEDLSIQKMDLLVKMEKTQEDYRNKLNENYALLDSLFNHAKNSFFSAGNEFGLLISIFTNLLISSQFEKDLMTLCSNKPGRFFSFAEMLQARSKEKISEIVEELGNDGCLIKYHKFFQGLKTLKNELNQSYTKNSSLARFIFQIPIALIINNPNVQITFEKDTTLNEFNGDLMNINTMIELIKTNKNDFDLLHKLIYGVNRLFSKLHEYRPVIETIKKLIEEIKKILLIKGLPLFVARECFRLCCTFTQEIDHCILWLKFDSSKLNVDYSNTNDVVLKFMKDEYNWNHKSGIYTPIGTKEGKERNDIDKDKDRDKCDQLIMLPYQKIKAFNDKMGIVIQSPLHFLLPKPLNLSGEIETCYTIWFRMYNTIPTKQNKSWHTLLQDKSGLISLIAIDPAYRRIGCFSNEGEFIDSGIDLWQKDLSNKWIQLAMAFRSLGTSEEKKVTGNIIWYVNGRAQPRKGKVKHVINGEMKEYLTNKYVLPIDVQYIGNSRDFTEPFGIFCDLRIYKQFKDSEQIAYLYQLKDNSQTMNSHELDIEYLLYHNFQVEHNDVCVSYILDNELLSQEVLFFVLTFFNNLMINKDYRQKFYNFKLVMKLCEEGFLYESNDIKKELTKMLQILS